MKGGGLIGEGFSLLPGILGLRGLKGILVFLRDFGVFESFFFDFARHEWFGARFCSPLWLGA